MSRIRPKTSISSWSAQVYDNRLTDDMNDSLRLADNFGKNSEAALADGDLDGDGQVDFRDFLILAGRSGSVRS